MKRYGKYGKKPSWIVKWYGKYGRKLWKDMEIMKKDKLNSEKILKIWNNPSWIVKWYGKYGRKVSWIAKRYWKYGINQVE